MVRRRARDEEDDEEELEDTDDEEDEDDDEEDEDDERAMIREVHGWLSDLMADGKRKRAGSRDDRRSPNRRRKTKVKVREQSSKTPRNVKTLRRLFRRSG
jgi:ABC-type Zn2+ transport system substrate-binding protein/surface adhesin